MSATGVLDLQATLRTYLRTRDYQSFTTNLLHDLAEVLGVQWRGGYTQVCAVEADRLGAADAFHVTAEAMPLVSWACIQLPEDATWEATLAPSPRGFLVLAESYRPEGVSPLIGAIRAISWDAAPHDGRAGVFVTFYSGPGDHLAMMREQVDAAKQRAERAFTTDGNDKDVLDEVLAWEDTLTQAEAIAADANQRMGRLQVRGADHITWGSVMCPPPRRSAGTEAERALLEARETGRRLLMAVWTLLSQSSWSPKMTRSPRVR